MNKSKKIISLLFVVLLLVSIVPMSVSAAEIAYGDFSFKTDSLTREATLVDYNGDADSVNIPDTVYGYTVTRIDDLVFFKFLYQTQLKVSVSVHFLLVLS